MTNTLRDMISKKAEELFGVFYGYYKSKESKNISRDFNDSMKRELWKSVATHVIEKEISGRIEELCMVTDSKRIEILQDQLNQIRSIEK